MILSPIAAEMRAMDDVIRSRLRSDVVLINQIAEYIVGAGGKRLRPALLLLLSGAGGYRGRDHLTLAAVIEFIHTATLLHDDVVDESSLRRGRPTANALFGNAASVLVGDFLYSRSFQMMVDVGDMRVMRVLADATNVIAEGEVLQLLNVHDPEVDEDRYLQVIRYKTAKLFEASARLAAILCKRSSDEEELWAELGRRVGTAFQLVDDVLDYSGVTADIGKNVGDDLREGKPTLPLIYLLENGTPAQQTLIRGAIVQGEDVDLDSIRTEIQESGALQYARAMAQAESDAALAIATRLPDSPHKDSLIELCAFAICRDY
ncbi:MAG: polyprenyl synthetase family protein [Burkholderiaceae bacterium]